MADRLSDIEPCEATALFAALPFSQHAKAKALGYSLASISRWEQGDRPAPERRKMSAKIYKIKEASWFTKMPANPPEPYGGGRAWQTSEGQRAGQALRRREEDQNPPDLPDDAPELAVAIRRALERP